MNKKYLIILCGILFILIGSFTELFSNLWCELTGRGFFIPKESNIFIFKVTEWNEGSGEWWLYGEDKKYYYALSEEFGRENYDPKYYKLLKGYENKNFNRFDYKTWN